MTAKDRAQQLPAETVQQLEILGTIEEAVRLLEAVLALNIEDVIRPRGQSSALVNLYLTEELVLKITGVEAPFGLSVDPEEEHRFVHALNSAGIKTAPLYSIYGVGGTHKAEVVGMVKGETLSQILETITDPKESADYFAKMCQLLKKIEKYNAKHPDAKIGLDLNLENYILDPRNSKGEITVFDYFPPTTQGFLEQNQDRANPYFLEYLADYYFKQSYLGLFNRWVWKLWQSKRDEIREYLPGLIQQIEKSTGQNFKTLVWQWVDTSVQDPAFIEQFVFALSYFLSTSKISETQYHQLLGPCCLKVIYQANDTTIFFNQLAKVKTELLEQI